MVGGGISNRCYFFPVTLRWGSQIAHRKKCISFDTFLQSYQTHLGRVGFVVKGVVRSQAAVETSLGRFEAKLILFMRVDVSIGKEINLRAKLGSPLREDIMATGHDDLIGDHKGSSIVNCFKFSLKIEPLASQNANCLV